MYRTSDIARAIGVHPNTVRLYEKNELIPYAKRQPNGYRTFSDFHLDQFRLARTAFEIEILQNGLRKTAVTIVKLSAQRKFDQALTLADEYLEQIGSEIEHAEEALVIVRSELNDEKGEADSAEHGLTRKEAAQQLTVTIDTLRNWEMNGLLTVKRNHNGYRMYTHEDMQRLKIIRSLRVANYSLSAILRMLNALKYDSTVNIEEVINTPRQDEEIVSACDNLLTSLHKAEKNTQSLIEKLTELKKKYT
ncbi:MAG: MerR family transcriptional regulator [Alkalibacterium sp.]|nr:MerR family transcriptional regulator [Alkalibacterium sp.]